jgi:hypothetical protein
MLGELENGIRRAPQKKEILKGKWSKTGCDPGPFFRARSDLPMDSIGDWRRG